MKHIYYFFGIMFIVYELIWLATAKERVRLSENYRKWVKENKEKKFDYSDMPDEIQKKSLSLLFISLPFLIWMFAGLLTFNWLSCGIFILFEFVIISPLSKLIRGSIAYLMLHIINTVITIAFIIFMVINSYHLEIDSYEYLLMLFNTY